MGGGRGGAGTARVVAVGRRRRRRQPCASRRRRAVAAQFVCWVRTWSRLPAAAARRREICITFDDGPDPEVTPRVLDLLDRHGAKASFFCIGERALAHPGHRGGRRAPRSRRGEPQPAALHGVRLGTDRAACSGRSKRPSGALSGITGSAPRFFRAPFGMRNPAAGAGPGTVRTAARVVDAARLRHGAARSGAGSGAR
ncbi:MAG: polysaccharide deacetylase family protein [Comamonadaceae bacterium]|nr:polysaccharide deacetylase family protein [Comamonadaceae bacterium]